MKTIETVKSALRRLDLSDSEQNIYLSLLSAGQATARVLSSRTGITRPSVYDQIKELKKLGLVVELDIENKAHYAAADLKHLTALLDDKIDHLEQSRVFLKDALPSLRDSLETVDPKVRFFEGAPALKNMLKDVMWHDSETIKILWPAKEMAEVFDATFLKWFDERRTARKLIIQSIWPENTHKSDIHIFSKLSDDTQRTLSGEIPPMGYVIYGNKVAFISSGAEVFGYIIESKEHKTLQTFQFEALWNTAKKCD